MKSVLERIREVGERLDRDNKLRKNNVLKYDVHDQKYAIHDKFRYLMPEKEKYARRKLIRSYVKSFFGTKWLGRL